jgi:ethanolamine utilization protein EutA
MYSIGVDIGTSTTEIIISNIKISTRLGPSLLPATEIDETEVIYRSPVIFTPLISKDTIDFEQIREWVKMAFHESGIEKDEIETGAVIITGETARKDNARQVSTWLSEYLGDFVVSTAGPKLESVLAGRGAGISEESKKRSKKIINLDIGGGTLNAAVFDSGICTETFAIHAKITIILIGERPGLATGESLSAYMAYESSTKKPESQRTVVSNIHKNGMPPVEAGAQIISIVDAMMEAKTSGIDLKL